MDDIALTYYGHVFDATGYGQAARANIHALHAAGVMVSVIDLSGGLRQVDDPLVTSLTGRRTDGADLHLFHSVPSVWAPHAIHLRNVIGMTVWETDTMPPEWTDILSRVIDVWLPCEFNVNTFRSALRTPIFRLPHPVVPRVLNGAEVDPSSLFGVNAADFVFYSIFEWQDRKGPCETLRAYFRAFPHDGEHVLVMKTSPAAAAVGAAAVGRLRHESRSAARVALIAACWSEARINALHVRGDCYVSLHRGEGWGYPLFEAATRGKSVVATAYSGPMDYLAPGAARFVPFTLAAVRQRYIHYHPWMQWAEPDVDRAAQLMREAFAQRKSAGAQVSTIASELRESYSLCRVGAMAKERLLELLRDRHPQRWRDVRLKALPPPATPIPAGWYDEDYFEYGLKSNWSNGYSWAAFGGLFHATASYLIELFPHATSYLDAGCAKGFLVRALREAGKDCWGFDHSAWAVGNAEPAASPFVELASVDDVRFERDVDLLLAFDLLSELTEDQACSFLRRARERTKMAVVAVITSFEDDEEERRNYRSAEDRDRSHVTRRQRRWWHALFEETGWKQDALHRIAAERCQRHELPSRMSWKTYVYAP